MCFKEIKEKVGCLKRTECLGVNKNHQQGTILTGSFNSFNTSLFLYVEREMQENERKTNVTQLQEGRKKVGLRLYVLRTFYYFYYIA